MTAPYKKRALAGWNHDKKQSNKDERQVEPLDIKEQLAETHKAKPSKTKKNSKDKHAINLVRNMRNALKFGDGYVHTLKAKAVKQNDSWFGSFYMEYYQKAKKAMPELQVLVDDQELSGKTRRLIRDILDQYKDQVW